MSKIIHKSEQLRTTCDQAYNRWTLNDESPLFFAPKCSIEMKIGGKYEQYFLLENESGLKGSEGCKVLGFIPNKMFSFSWNAPPEIPEVRNHEHKTWVVITFTELEDRLCLVDLYHLGFLQGNAWNETITYFEKAWEIVLNNLQASFVE